VLFFKPKGTGHTTTAGVEHVEIETKFRQLCFFVRQLHDRFMMAVPMYNSLAVQPRRLVVRCLLLSFDVLFQRSYPQDKRC
jgi:hypothetical protein